METRPVVIFKIKNGQAIVAYATITGTNIKDFEGKYDKWKVPIFKWATAGLEKGSYVKANCYAYIPISIFENKKTKDYIGQMDQIDFNNTIQKIDEFVESGETPW
jgi:hypothetical protein